MEKPNRQLLELLYENRSIMKGNPLVYYADEMDAFLEEQAAKLKDVLCFNEYEDEKKFEIMRALRGKAEEKSAREAGN